MTLQDLVEGSPITTDLPARYIFIHIVPVESNQSWCQDLYEPMQDEPTFVNDTARWWSLMQESQRDSTICGDINALSL